MIYSGMYAHISWHTTLNANVCSLCAYVYLCVCARVCMVFLNVFLIKSEQDLMRIYLYFFRRSVFGWTEYVVYYIFASSFGLWERYHHVVPLEQWLRSSVWSADAVRYWNASAVFTTAADVPGYFSVFQTNTHMPGTFVRDQMQAYLPAEPHFTFNQSRSNVRVKIRL